MGIFLETYLKISRNILTATWHKVGRIPLPTGGIAMKRLLLSLVVISLTVGFVSCGKKHKFQPEPPPPFTAGNAIQQYGGVMGKTYQKAKAMDVILPLKQLVDSFYVQEGRYPTSLQELVDKGYIKELPKPPTDRGISYDSTTGTVSLK